MKLINKISVYFLLSSIPIFILISTGQYFAIEKVITGQVDEQLENISAKTIQEIKDGKFVSFPPFVEVSLYNSKVSGKSFQNVTIESKDDEDEPFRQITSFAQIGGKNYRIIARISLIEKEDMLASLFMVSIYAIIIFIMVLFLINKIVSKKILKDFYKTLALLEDYSLSSKGDIVFAKSKIKEFNKLNESFKYFASKARNEFRSLKEFNEELNHEIQTPIAVIKSKLEILLQSANLDEENLRILDTSLKNLTKLERINKSILLLNKLGHKELFESADLNIAEEIKNIISFYADFINDKNITVNLSLNDSIKANMNSSLLNIMLSNLISNAIRHNIQNGVINITLKDNALEISNSGNKPKSKTENFFIRFYKESDSSDSIGLGLTIVKKICELYDIQITNAFIDDLHCAKLLFNKTVKSK
jgi:signal transduction histidine kinase